jgi:hypothetical protein
MLLARQNPKCDILLHRCLLSLVHAYSFAGHYIDQFRPVVAMVISATIRRKNGMTEGDFFDTFLIGSEQDLNLTREWGRNFDALLFPSLDDLQVDSFLNGMLYGEKVITKPRQYEIDYYTFALKYTRERTCVKRNCTDKLRMQGRSQAISWRSRRPLRRQYIENDYQQNMDTDLCTKPARNRSNPSSAKIRAERALTRFDIPFHAQGSVSCGFPVPIWTQKVRNAAERTLNDANLRASGALVLVSCAATYGQSQAWLGGLAEPRDYIQKRVSSYDHSGGNEDYKSIAPGETFTILDEYGPGISTHIRFTFSSDEMYHLKKLVFRMYWEGEATPSVEAPIGDFFGLGLGAYFTARTR